LNIQAFAERMDGGHKRLILWMATATSLSLLLYRRHVAKLVFKGGEMLSGDVGTSYPLAGLILVAVFLLLRWQDLHQILLRERGLTSRPTIRLAGLIFALSPLLFTNDLEGPRAYVLPILAAAMVLVWYGMSLAVNPLTFRMLLPYAFLCVVSILSPGPVQSMIGEPLASLTSLLSRLISNLMGVPALWWGREAEFLSQRGGRLHVDITPGCSSISSISIFLLLCGLMHLDLKSDLSSTLKLASLGTVALILINALRISTLMWVGYMFGWKAFRSLHSWLGYAIFTGFYLTALVVYLGTKHPSKITTSIEADAIDSSN